MQNFSCSDTISHKPRPLDRGRDACAHLLAFLGCRRPLAGAPREVGSTKIKLKLLPKSLTHKLLFSCLITLKKLSGDKFTS